MTDVVVGDGSAFLPAGSPTETIAPRYALGEETGSYVGRWTGQVVKHPVPADDEDEWVRAQTGYCRPHPGPSVGNFMVRRDPVALVSGDLPRFGLLDYRRVREISPTPFLLGDVRIQLTIAGKTIWLDEHGDVEARYFPWGTKHHVVIGALTVTVTAALVATIGMAITLTIAKLDAIPFDVMLCYGGLGLADMARRGPTGMPIASSRQGNR